MSNPYEDGKLGVNQFNYFGEDAELWRKGRLYAKQHPVVQNLIDLRIAVHNFVLLITEKYKPITRTFAVWFFFALFGFWQLGLFLAAGVAAAYIYTGYFKKEKTAAKKKQAARVRRNEEYIERFNKKNGITGGSSGLRDKA